MRARASRVLSMLPELVDQLDLSGAVLPPRARRGWRPIDRPYLPVYAGPVTQIGTEPRTQRDFFTRKQDESELAAQLEARLGELRAELDPSAAPPMILVIATVRGWGTAAVAIRVAAAAPEGTTVGLAVRLPKDEVRERWRRLAPASPGFVLNSATDLRAGPLRNLRLRSSPLGGWGSGPTRDARGLLRIPRPEPDRLMPLFESLEGLCAEAAAVRERYLGGAGFAEVLPALADATEACGCRGLAPEALEGLYTFLLRPPPLHGWIPLDDAPRAALTGVDDLVRLAEERDRVR